MQLPQLSVPPHPSEMTPQFLPCAAHVVGVHVPMPHTFCVPPPPHVFMPVQVPQFSVPPHPSAAVPQVHPRAAHVVGEQHRLGVAPPQTAGAVHAPQLNVPPHPSA